MASRGQEGWEFPLVVPPYKPAHQSLQRCPDCGQEMWASLDGKVSACWPCVKARTTRSAARVPQVVGLSRLTFDGWWLVRLASLVGAASLEWNEHTGATR